MHRLTHFLVALALLTGCGTVVPYQPSETRVQELGVEPAKRRLEQVLEENLHPDVYFGPSGQFLSGWPRTLWPYWLKTWPHSRDRHLSDQAVKHPPFKASRAEGSYTVFAETAWIRVIVTLSGVEARIAYPRFIGGYPISGGWEQRLTTGRIAFRKIREIRLIADTFGDECTAELEFKVSGGGPLLSQVHLRSVEEARLFADLMWSFKAEARKPARRKPLEPGVSKSR